MDIRLNSAHAQLHAMHLQTAVAAIFQELGCIHHIPTSNGAETHLVPIERACFDLEGHIVWVEYSRERFPRGFLVERLREPLFAEKVADLHGYEVLVAFRNNRVIVVSGLPGLEPVI
jgi:hypothetical protein